MDDISMKDIWDEIEKSENENKLAPGEFTVSQYLKAHPGSKYRVVYRLLEEMVEDGRATKRMVVIGKTTTGAYKQANREQ